MKKIVKLAVIMLILSSLLMIHANVKATTGTLGTGDGSSSTEDGTTDGDTTDNEEDDETTDGSGEENKELTWTNGENVKFSFVLETSTYFLQTSGLDSKKDYYIYLSNGTKNNPTWNTTMMPVDYTYKYNPVGKGQIVDKYIAANGDIYVSIVERQATSDSKFECKIIIQNRKIERPAQQALGLRMQCYFFNEYTSAFIKEPGPISTNGERKIKVKIGTISDKKILKDIKDGKSNAMTNLLNYAKNANSIYTGTFSTGRSDSITSKLGLTNKGYYYVYMVADDENGKYYPIEDVSLYQANISASIGANLWDYLDENFKWDLEDEKQEDNKQEEQKKEEDKTVIPNKKLPQTGVSVTIAIIIAVVVIAGVVFAVKSKKYNI